MTCRDVTGLMGIRRISPNGGTTNPKKIETPWKTCSLSMMKIPQFQFQVSNLLILFWDGLRMVKYENISATCRWIVRWVRLWGKGWWPVLPLIWHLPWWSSPTASSSVWNCNCPSPNRTLRTPVCRAMALFFLKTRNCLVCFASLGWTHLYPYAQVSRIFSSNT